MSTIGEGAQIAATSEVNGDVPAGARWGGTPAKPVKQWFREMKMLRADGGAAKAAADAAEASEAIAMDEAVETLEAADIAVVLKALPHRYPFLMVDRVIDIHGDESRHRHQERHHQRAALPGPLSRQSGVSRAC